MVVRKRIFGAGITIGLLFVGLFALSRLNIGGKLLEGAKGAGGFIPDLLGSFGEGFAEKGTDLAEGLQRGLTGGLLFSEQKQFGGGGFVGGTVTSESIRTQPGQELPTFFTQALAAFKESQSPLSTKVGQSQLKLVNLFTPQVQDQRISNQIRLAELIQAKQHGGTAFGGFDSAEKQETQLQLAIAEARAKFPGFFK